MWFGGNKGSTVETMQYYDVGLSDQSMAVLADRTVEIRTSMPNDMIDDVAFAVLTLWTCDTWGRGLECALLRLERALGIQSIL